MSVAELCSQEVRVINFIQICMDDETRIPSYEEIRTALGLSSKDFVSRLLDGLEDKGYLERKRNRSRSLSLLRTSNGQPYQLGQIVRIPILGIGPASFDVSSLDGFAPGSYVELTRDLIPDATGIYALQVRGDSMIDAHINDGDIVVLRQQPEARNGDLVQVWVQPDESPTLKRYYRQGNRICLRPENPALQPRYLTEEEVQVQGKVVLVIRSLEQKLAA